jgi:hypothetical protein
MDRKVGDQGPGDKLYMDELIRERRMRRQDRAGYKKECGVRFGRATHADDKEK